MEIQYTLEKEDFIQFNLKQLSMDPKTRRAIGGQVILPILVILALTIFNYVQGTLSTLRLVLSVALMVAWPFFYMTFFKRGVKKRLSKIIDQKADGLNLGPRTVFIDEKGLKDSLGLLPFHSLHHLEESQGYFFFHQTKDAAYILPKRDLSQEQIDYVKEIFEKVQKKYT